MNTSAMTCVILMKISLKMQIIHAPLTVKGTPVCSSLQQGLPRLTWQSLAFQLKSSTAAHRDTGQEFGGTQNCDSDLVRAF